MSSMRGLRFAAWAVAVSAYVFIGLGALRRGRRPGWIPLGPLSVRRPGVPRAGDGGPTDRDPSAAERDRLDPAARAVRAYRAMPLAFVLSKGWTLQMDRAKWPLLYAWPIAVAYVFPNGHLLSPGGAGSPARRRHASSVSSTVAMLDPAPFYGDDASVPNPLADNAVAGLGSRTRGSRGSGSSSGSASSGASSPARSRSMLRLRRSTGIERLQTMWLAWAAALIPLGLFLCGLSAWVLGDSVDWVLFPFLLLMQVAVAASVGIAVARYRLYAIERIVNRTLVYASLTFVLLGAYTAITVGLGVVVGRGSAWVTALATLAVALAFRPLRARIQDLVDRRYRRARYEGVRRVRTFEDEVRDGRRAPEEIGAVLAEALGDPLAELLFWLPETEAYADASGEIARPAADARAQTEIHRDDARTAVLLHDPALLERRDLLTASSRLPRCRSRWRGCESRSASSSPRWRRRGCGSWRPATRSDADSSATSTTAPSSGSSRSACSSGACR